MSNPFPPFARRSLTTLKAIATTIRTTAVTLWRAHLSTLRTSPTYELGLLALIDLILGQRVDLRELLIRLLTRFKRIEPPEDLEGWAY